MSDFRTALHGRVHDTQPLAVLCGACPMVARRDRNTVENSQSTSEIAEILQTAHRALAHLTARPESAADRTLGRAS